MCSMVVTLHSLNRLDIGWLGKGVCVLVAIAPTDMKDGKLELPNWQCRTLGSFEQVKEEFLENTLW